MLCYYQLTQLYHLNYLRMVNCNNPLVLTANMLLQQTDIKKTTRIPKGWVNVKNAKLHNLKNIDVDFPLGVMVVIAGVAGSGKSSLMDCLRKELNDDNAVYIKQKNIGINLRSTPATYLDIWDEIRNIFARTNKVSNSYFSFNSKGGCPACQGKGVIVSGMAFMDSIETVCEVCKGNRFSKEALTFEYNGKNIAEVMNLTVNQAIDFFAKEKFINKLSALQKVGLGYLHLNQSMTTLSGGELQRVKLAEKLDDKGKIFILDEPTDGLHLDDIRKLMILFNKMTDNGNSLFIIAHSIDVIKDADYIIELGEGGGIHGGEVLYSGTVDNIKNCEKSVTREFL